MKRIKAYFFILFFAAPISHAASIRIEVKIHYFQPSEADFRNIYGRGFQYGGELDFGLLGGLEFWMGGSYFSKTGETTFTEEEIRLGIIPLGGGLKYGITVGSFNLYTGLGLSYYRYKETDFISGADIIEGKIGYVGKLGSIIHLTKGLVLDFCFEYSTCKMKPADFSFDIGGLSFGIGLGYEF